MNALGSAGLLDNIVIAFSCKVKVELHKKTCFASYISHKGTGAPFRDSCIGSEIEQRDLLVFRHAGKAAVLLQKADDGAVGARGLVAHVAVLLQHKDLEIVFG